MKTLDQKIRKKENSNACKVAMDINPDGTFQITNLNTPDICKDVFARINPVRGVLWKSNLADSEKKKIGLQTL